MNYRETPIKHQLKFQLIRFLRWFVPGIGIKRWGLLIILGSMLIGLGFAVVVIEMYRNTPDTWYLPVVAFLSLRFLSRPVRALIFGLGGIFLIIIGVWGINRTLLRPFLRPGKHLVDTVSYFQKLDKGKKIVVIGGGTGLSALLRGLKKYTANITAIVTVADDGGSSGEIRKKIGILPPGDIRNCLTALSNDEELTTQLFQYRFGEEIGLNGHSLGNLLITALTDITGSFEEAVAESGRVLAVQGKVLPSTLHDVRLVAQIHLENEKKDIKVKGESEIPRTKGKVKRVWLEPNNPLAYPPTIQAILGADIIIIGPGSLYTSIIPNLLVPDISAAIRASRGLKFFVCNVATQPGETDGYSCGDHVKTIEKEIGKGLFDVVICNDNCNGRLPEDIEFVCLDNNLENEYPVYSANLSDSSIPWRHDSLKLATAILDLYNERTGPIGRDLNSEL
ncbi:MAG TPA: YvcK family protein [Anaerolineaceae bacterium]|nr:YvcK family protein [Anaerolineaceae bacterium]